MDASDPGPQTDPITAALPPNSDYITYLTILEYQLTPERVSILTRHLVEDDGTLAKEIGWDLVKILLPLLRSVPEDAAKCLEVIARRGNPREVVVRVAEALEILGQDDGDDADAISGPDLDSDPLPTFKGEAERIHLGDMKLEGMPPGSEAKRSSDQKDLSEEQQSQSRPVGILGKQFSALLSMLSLLHPRIKTQYPSRFLATSLPAALAAYRQIEITSDTTQAFLVLLGKLSGAKQRPKLPPRSSTASVRHLQTLPPTGTEVYAPLPDPEGGSEENAKAPAEIEKSIVQRLLQAVALEVLEEYLLASATTMEWSTRLYEKQAPKRMLPNRTSRMKAWQEEGSLRLQDGMIGKFLALAKDLGLSAENVFRSTNLPLMPKEDQGINSEAEEDEDEEKSEYPTTPSQIPYPHLGSLFLFLASSVPTLIQPGGQQSPLEISTPNLHHFLNQFVLPTHVDGSDQTIPSLVHNQPAAVDGLLALLFLVKMPPKQESAAPSSTSEEDDFDYRSLIDILSFLSAEQPDALLRTSANHIATVLLYKSPSPVFRLTIIKSALKSRGPFENLKEVAIGWLKDELLATITTANIDQTVKDDALERPNESNMSTNNNGIDEPNVLASPNLFDEDEELTHLIFRLEEPSSLPSPSLPQHDHPVLATHTYTPSTLNSYIASLNLLFLLLTNQTLKSRYHDSLTSKITISDSDNTTSDDGDNQNTNNGATDTNTTVTSATTNDQDSKPVHRHYHHHHHAQRFLNRMRTYLDEQMADPKSIQKSSNGGSSSSAMQDEKLGQSLAILALAVGRVVGAVEALRKE